MSQSDNLSEHVPYRSIAGDFTAGLVIVCDHASSAVPPDLHALGLPLAELQRHIAWDIGAAPLAQILAKRFQAPATLCGTSRLVIDCNRDPSDPASIPTVSDRTVIPGNHHLTVWDRTQRIARWFTPYHDAVEAMVDAALAATKDPVLLSVHSMTPQMQGGEHRPWPVALSWYQDDRLVTPMLAALRKRVGDTVGDNQPYALDPAEDYSVPFHAMRRGLRYIQVEFRQDLIAGEAGAKQWAALFGDALAETLGLG